MKHTQQVTKPNTTHLPFSVHVSCIHDEWPFLHAVTHGDGLLIPVPRAAVVGGVVIRYATSPWGAFIGASLIVATGQRSVTPGASRGRWFAEVDDLVLLPRPVARLTMLALVPNWRYPKMPGPVATVPEALAYDVLLAAGLDEWAGV